MHWPNMIWLLSKETFSCALLPFCQQMLCPAFRDMEVEDAIELGRRSIYHATFRDAVSGGTVSGMYSYSSIL